MKLSLVAAPALLCLGFASMLLSSCQGVFVVKPSSIAPPEDILGEHQPLVKTWTIYSTSGLTSLTFQGSSTVFVEYDPAMKTDPAPALPGTPDGDLLPFPPLSPLPPLPPMTPIAPVAPAPPSSPALPSPPVPPMMLSVVDRSFSGSESGTNDVLPVAPTEIQLQAVAKVIVSGDSKDVLGRFNVVTSSDSDHNSGLELVLNLDPISKGGYALTQLFVVQKRALSSIKAISSGDVVIGENVLANDNITANVSLSSIGSGDVFLSSNETLSIGSLDIFTAGSGDVQVQFASLNVSNAITLTCVASGDIAVLADNVTAAKVQATVVGSSALYLQANSVNVTNLNSFLGGSGSVTVSKAGTCVNQTVTIAGSGDVKTGSVACKNADVSIFGSGDALVQAESKLSVTLVASGSVEYVNKTPKQLIVQGLIFRKRLSHRVTHVEENKFHVYKPEHVPSHKAVYIHGKKKHHRFRWWDIFGGGDDDSDDDSNDNSDDHNSSDSSDSDEDQGLRKHHFKIVFNDGSASDRFEIGTDDMKPRSSMNLAASAGPKSRGPSAASIIGVFGVAMGVVCVAAFKYKQRHARQQYTPLF